MQVIHHLIFPGFERYERISLLTHIVDWELLLLSTSCYWDSSMLSFSLLCSNLFCDYTELYQLQYNYALVYSSFCHWALRIFLVFAACEKGCCKPSSRFCYLLALRIPGINLFCMLVSCCDWLLLLDSRSGLRQEDFHVLHNFFWKGVHFLPQYFTPREVLTWFLTTSLRFITTQEVQYCGCQPNSENGEKDSFLWKLAGGMRVCGMDKELGGCWVFEVTDINFRMSEANFQEHSNFKYLILS